MTSFARRRRFLAAYRLASFRFDRAMWWLWEDIFGHKPRRTSRLGLAVLFFWTACPVCFGLRLFTIGVLLGSALSAAIVYLGMR